MTKNEAHPLKSEQLCQILTDIYFHAPLKHPIRSTTSRALQRESVISRDIVINSLLRTLTETDVNLNKSLQSDEIDINGIIQYISSLIGCFENFREAISAIELYLMPLLNTMYRIVDIFMKILQNAEDLSPAKRSKFYANLHNAIRVELFAVQQFQDKIVDANILLPILSQAWLELLDNPVFSDLPIDTKINCGILKVYYDRFFGDIFAPRDKILTQFRVNASTVSDKTSLSKELYYGVAIINTIAEKDFADENFCTVVRIVIEHMIEIGKAFVMDSWVMIAITRGLMQFTRRTLNNLRKISSKLSDADEVHLKETSQNCLRFVWLNVHHSAENIRYAIKDLLKSLLRMGHEQYELFGHLIQESFAIAKSSNTSDTLVCILLDMLSQTIRTERILNEIIDIQERVSKNIFKDICWSNCYERLLIINSWEIDFDTWCERWITPLISIDENAWKNDFDRLKIIRNLFERALRTKPEAAEFILKKPNISVEIHLFVLWTMRKSGRKLYAPENYRASADPKVINAKFHQSDEIRILAFRILIECHKTSEKFPIEDLNEILEFFKYNCNAQNPTTRQDINSTIRRAMERIECGYLAAMKVSSLDDLELCTTYKDFLNDLIIFCIDWCLFNGANFGRRSIGMTTLLRATETWQKLLPDDHSIYSEKFWSKLQEMLSDSYVIIKDTANEILLLCHRYYSQQRNLIYNLSDLKKKITTFRPYDTMTAAHYLVFCSFSNTYFRSYYEAVIWCENILDEGLKLAKGSLMQATRHNALYGSLLSIRHLLGRVELTKITDPIEIESWRLFFHRMIPKCKELTDFAAPIVRSSAPEGHLPEDLNDVSHYSSIDNEEYLNGNQIKVTPQMILVCAWRTVRETALLLGEISLYTPVITSSEENGLITVDQLIEAGMHFQQLLAETKHRGAFEQSFLGFSNLCLRLWRSNETKLHSYPMKLVQKIAAVISGERVDDDTDLDVKKLCATRRSAGIPFMIQGVVTTEVQVCSSAALTFCMNTFLNIAKTGVVEESRTHSLNILRALFR